ncbi:hypothetical protein B0F90DRAFT_1940148 [Multifurca ochricompacta]|uniref:Uncharacterized protein n=1 Tax=Multifurca ochricompacta TaxID=376703 RepID=A0AAD4M0J3_9AGAM|nr:hypothetical protein B0F90DRAFT_1940148 [Multifurca ochricompacta]
MVDEVATKVITIPMCLRSSKSQGFPPPDIELRDWLCSVGGDSDADALSKKLHGFVYALLTVTEKRLEDIESDYQDDFAPQETTTIGRDRRRPRLDTALLVQEHQEKLAKAFREHMTVDQGFRSSNDYRRDFFKAVVDEATKFMASCERVHKENRSPSPYAVDGNGVREAGLELCQFVDPEGCLDPLEGPRRPLVILAFDESHVLGDTPPGKGWTLFAELRRTLRELVELPVFSLFLSTAGKFHVFSPEIGKDPSNRVANMNLSVLHPIAEISFDDLMTPPEEDSVTVDEMVDDRWITHLGRPLFGTHYDSLVKAKAERELMVLTKQKLLDGSITLDEDLNGQGALACLSVRFSLEFNLAHSYGRELARTQVERHMRLCLVATTGLEDMITVVGSEPYLAEAARLIISGAGVNPIRCLVENSDLNCVDRGQRGELAATLIVMQARDAASSETKRRWVFVADFMKALLPASAYDELKESLPTLSRRDEDKPFESAFKGYCLWFNHVIKVKNSDKIGVDSLWEFITQGAMILFINDQRGVDIVLPVCVRDEKLSPRTTTAILIQVKNDKSYQYNISQFLFDAMEPYQVRLFPKGHTPLPVIRMVFALASSKAGVSIPAAPQRRHHYNPSTCYDVWCAGVSGDTFKASTGIRAGIRFCCSVISSLLTHMYWERSRTI